MLAPEQLNKIKKQLIDQIDQLFPEDKRELATEKILSMNETELETFLKQNNLLDAQQPNPFRLIVSEKIPSSKIDENKNCIAVLELNPISEGHTLVIPKTAVKEGKKIPTYLNQFAEKIAKKLKSKLKPKKVSIIPTPMFDEIILNVLPIYNDETINSKKTQASPEDLQKVLQKIKKITIKNITPKPIQIKEDEKLWLPKRIP